MGEIIFQGDIFTLRGSFYDTVNQSQVRTLPELMVCIYFVEKYLFVKMKHTLKCIFFTFEFLSLLLRWYKSMTSLL